MIKINPYNNISFKANCVYHSELHSDSKYKFEKKIFNYAPQKDSFFIKKYTGPMKKTDGISTEASNYGEPYGGGWLLSDINTPLSTSGVYTCAVLNLVNEKDNSHILMHVLHSTPSHYIKEFIDEKFSDFTKANIVGGEQLETIKTMKSILAAVKDINPDIKTCFYNTVTQNPEIIAYKGEIFYMPNKTCSLSFAQNKENYI